MRDILLGVSSVVVVLLGITPVFGASEEGLQIKVTPVFVSVQLSTSLVDMGVVQLGQEKAYSDTIAAKNNGSVMEDFDIKGSSAQGASSSWALSEISNGPDLFMLKVSSNNWGTETALTEGFVHLQDSIEPDANHIFGRKLNFRPAQ